MDHINANPINSDIKENNIPIPIIKHAKNAKIGKHAVKENIEQ